MKGKASSDQLLYENGEKKYEFYAFISYKHGNKRWAKWVQKRLELYRLPIELLEENEALPPNISPVCRDDTDLTGGGDVDGQLSDRVAKCKYLIVVCSKKMQNAPQYIDLEIEAFLNSGNKSARIIPFVIDGEPNSSDPDKECLPPALKRLGDKIPVCVFLDRMHPREAMITLAASILGIERKALKSHDQAHRQRQTITGLIVGAVFLAGLVSFVLWQLFNVKEAKLHEQLTYAEDTFRQGDRTGAQQISQTAADDYIRLMDSEIKDSAQALSRLSAIHPKYQPVTALCQDVDGSRAIFTADGGHVLIITESLVRKYDLSGNLVMSFEPPESAHKIVDVSADGVHAVIMTVFLSGYETELWLWNMETDEGVSYLVGSGNYSAELSREGNFHNVVNACFSPDGSIVCAYRDDDGYFNENEELAAWDCKTGAKLFSFPAELLGEGNQSYEVEEFRFIGNDTLYWHGTKNHVFYTLGDKEPLVVARRSMPDKKNKGIYHFSDLRCYIDRYTGLVENVLTGQTLQLDFEIPSVLMKEDIHKFWEPFEVDGRYVLIKAYAQDASSRWLCDVKLLDLQSMSVQAYAEDFASLCRGSIVNFKKAVEGSPYIYATVSGQGLYRFDCVSGEYLQINIENAESYEYIGRYNNADVLAAKDDGCLSIVEIDGMRPVFYSLDTDQDEFLGSALVSSNSSDPHLLAKHNGSYYLFPMYNPGVKLDEGGDSYTEYAVGAGGQLIVRGAENSLKVWQDGKPLMTAELPERIVDVGADAKGRYFALSGSRLDLYDETGSAIGSIYPEDGMIFSSAKLSNEGERLAVLSMQDSPFADNVYELALYDSSSLEAIGVVSGMVHVAPGGLAEIAYDISPGGKWLGAVVRIPEEGGSQYQLGVHVWKGSDGSLAAQTQNINQEDVPVFELLNVSLEAVASASRMRYVSFPSDKELLCGLQYGTWIMDLENMESRSFVAESYDCDALPDMLKDGSLIYPHSGVHVWSVDEDTNKLENVIYHQQDESEGIALFNPENLKRLYISEDKKWLTIRGERDTWLYSTQNWEHKSIAASQPVQVLYIDDGTFIYVTEDGLLYLEK